MCPKNDSGDILKQIQKIRDPDYIRHLLEKIGICNKCSENLQNLDVQEPACRGGQACRSSS